MSSTADRMVPDVAVIDEIESTIPGHETMQAAFKVTPKEFVGFGFRKDGREVCECFEIPDEGGYAYRLRDTTTNTKQDWRFARIGDFEANYDIRYDVKTQLQELEKRVQALMKANRNLYKAMGTKSRNRIGNKITDSLFGDK